MIVSRSIGIGIIIGGVEIVVLKWIKWIPLFQLSTVTLLAIFKTINKNFRNIYGGELIFNGNVVIFLGITNRLRILLKNMESDIVIFSLETMEVKFFMTNDI